MKEKIENPDITQDLIIDYLYKQTNYALMLTASWGAGKTYFLKNRVFSKVLETGYKPIIVSLFGISSMEELKDKIFVSVYPLIENKYLKAGFPIVKLLMKAADITKLWGGELLSHLADGADEAKNELKTQRFNFLALEKLLICFDDLERIDAEMLKDNSVLGFINSLVEQSNTKVIIVANEGKLPPDLFGEIKEKTIGNTLHFRQTFSPTFANIIENLQNTTSHYKSFLQEHCKTIENLLKYENEKDVNYRTLNYLLSYYAPIFQFIKSELKNGEWKDYQEKLLYSTLRFSLMICVEFKKGRIEYHKKQGLEKGIEYQINRMYDEIKKDRIVEYGEETINKYFPNEDYDYYESIFDYLTGGNIFNGTTFKKEVQTNYNMVDEKTPPAYKVFNQLAAANYKNLSDKDFISLNRQLLSYAKQGEFLLQDYLTVAYHVMRHENVLNLKPEKLAEDLIKGMKKSLPRQKYSPMIDKYLGLSAVTPNYLSLKKISDFIKSANKKLGETGEINKDKQLEDEFLNNYDSLHAKMLSEIDTAHYQVTLSGLRPSLFLKTFLKVENAKKNKIITLFTIIYHWNRGNDTEKDRRFLLDLKNLIEKYKEGKKFRNLSGELLLELDEQVNKKLESRISYSQ
ncbi:MULTISPECIES: P-loop NTPase fold protein [Pedobacter]|uniref:KAP family P-loop domain-containing protein n=1 Tax=Pedobacter suwonensis TaxID=332999 RepID=A0A1I0TTW4_9SPHI|nr:MULTISPECIES: P-loop NTPase fold protein [Pedobacter]SFA55142.1 KAP family P-loop domain-containing protein [Pedobacter suwonensis]